MRKIKEFLTATALGTAFLIPLAITSEYLDISGPGFKDMDGARAKNSISAVVGGIVGQKLYRNSHIDLNVEKTLWPDTRVVGDSTQKEIQTFLELALSHVSFKATNDENGRLTGKVDKSEFDWEVKQTGPNNYHIKRFGPKFNAELILNVGNGQIKGEYLRPGPHFSWKINGTYDSQNNVKIKISAPITLGVTLEGKVTPTPVSVYK